FSSRRRHTRSKRDWSSDVCSSDLLLVVILEAQVGAEGGDSETLLLGEFARPRRRLDVPGRHVGVAGPLDALEAGGRSMADDGPDVEVAEGDGAEAGSDHGGSSFGGRWAGTGRSHDGKRLPSQSIRGAGMRPAAPAPHLTARG